VYFGVAMCWLSADMGQWSAHQDCEHAATAGSSVVAYGVWFMLLLLLLLLALLQMAAAAAAAAAACRMTMTLCVPRA
jgi:hypothetical protein